MKDNAFSLPLTPERSAAPDLSAQGVSGAALKLCPGVRGKNGARPERPMNIQTFNQPAVASPSQVPANGAAWAGILAAGIGCAAFGLFTDLSEASPRIGAALNWYNPAGSLSGVAGCAVAVWLGAWIAFAIAWRNRRLRASGGIMLLTILLVLAGLVMTFPPFYALFAGD